MKTLVIVESPAKAKTIKKYLPDGYRVEASMGHIIDLPREQMGINVEKDFKPLYITMPDKKEVAKRLKEQAKDSERIFWQQTRTERVRPSVGILPICSA